MKEEGLVDNRKAASAKLGSASKLVQARKSLAHYFVQPWVRLLARTGITPNVVSWIGFLVTTGAAALIVTRHLVAAGIVVLVAGLFDMFDGALARQTNRVSRFGGVLDSTLDRLSEAVLLIAIIAYYVKAGFITGVLLAAIALPSSFMVSYIRARAEAMGLGGEVGLFTRAERVVVLAAGLLLSQISYLFLVIALAILVVLGSITAAQRLLYVWQQTKNN